MMKQKAKVGAFLAFSLLAACGKVGPLEPTPGQTPPAKAIGQAEVPGSETLMTPSVQARPGRSDELMRRSERRVNDPFDLPPGSDTEETTAPAPAETESTPKK
mgnify:CR=1 FL=1